MDEKEENVTKTEVKQEGGAQVVKESRSSTSTEETRLTLANGVWLLLGILETLLALRFLLKMFGANPASGFASFLYSLTDVFTGPFKGIFSTPTGEGDIVSAVFEPATLLAMVVYALIAWAVIKLVHLNKSE